jgi:hypothetical protein
MLVTALEANADVPNVETVIKRLLNEERKMNEKTQVPTGNGEEVLTLKHKKRGPRCHYCNRFGHIQRNCHERSKKHGYGRAAAGQHEKTHKVNTIETKDRSDSDEILLMFQHSNASSTDTSIEKSTWIIDSGATCHVCHESNLFTELKYLNKPIDVVLGNGSILKANRSGTVALTFLSGSIERKYKLNDVLYVPELTYNLVSVSKAVEKGISLKFKENECLIEDANHKLIAVGSKVGNLYFVESTKRKDQLYIVTDMLADNPAQSSKSLETNAVWDLVPTPKD